MNKLMTKGTLNQNEAPIANISIYKIGSEWKGEIKFENPVKCTLIIWDKTQDGVKSKVNIFMSSFFFKTPSH